MTVVEWTKWEMAVVKWAMINRWTKGLKDRALMAVLKPADQEEATAITARLAVELEETKTKKMVLTMAKMRMRKKTMRKERAL